MRDSDETPEQTTDRLTQILGQLASADSINKDHHFSRTELAMQLARQWQVDHPEDLNLAQLRTHLAHARMWEHSQGAAMSESDARDGKKYSEFFAQQSERLVAVISNLLDREKSDATLARGAENQSAQDWGVTLSARLKEWRGNTSLSRSELQVAEANLRSNFGGPSPRTALMMDDFPPALRDAYYPDDQQFMEALQAGQITDPNALAKFQKRNEFREIWDRLADAYVQTPQAVTPLLADNPNLQEIRKQIAKYFAPTHADVPTLDDFSQAVARVATEPPQRTR
ncbi:MAG: hypothetical protein ACKVOE_10105 [Rickettsiales bacterium]